MKHIQSNAFKTTSWSGGKTTELFIYPEDASYAARNFQFRLSTATVEVADSIFTALPNINRTLMVLDGQMKLIHEGEHSVVLNPCESDRFKGGWNTRSEGECVDFNLMCMGSTAGELKGIELTDEQAVLIKSEVDFTFFYLYSGRITANQTEVNPGDLLSLHKGEEMRLVADCDCRCVRIDISGL